MKRPPKPRSSNQLRIIGGQWRSRRLPFPEEDGLRPTGDRLRETLFNWLMHDIDGAICLDLFAGSGALGLEALSRGAGQVTFIEKSLSAANQITANLRTLDSSQGKVICKDAFHFLQDCEEQYDIIFVDPPFAKDFWEEVISLLASKHLKTSSLIYVESTSQTSFSVPNDWSLYRSKVTGTVKAELYEITLADTEE